MKLPPVKDINAYVEALFGEEYTAELRKIAKPLNPLADATPLPWDTTPFPSEIEL